MPHDGAPTKWSAFWLLLLIAGTIAHALACFQPPRDAGDLTRQLLTGVMVAQEGWSAAARPISEWNPPLAAKASWGEVSYNYPPLALAFFHLIALASPALFTAKVALTLIEAANAVLLSRFFGDRRMGIVYWCLPLSIWWTSHEGCTEALQNFFTLLALVAWKRGREFAPAGLLLAIQAKISAIFLAPWLIWTCLRRQGASHPRLVVYGGLACLPTLAAMFFYPVISQVAHSVGWSSKFNLYHWRAAFDAGYRWWAPLSLVIWTQIATAAATIWIIAQIYRTPGRALNWSPVLIFFCAAKFLGVFQPWYFLALVPLWLPAASPSQRFGVLALTQCCEPLSVWQLFFGPSGPVGVENGLKLFETVAL